MAGTSRLTPEEERRLAELEAEEKAFVSESLRNINAQMKRYEQKKRYEIINIEMGTAKSVILLDTETGKTWLLGFNEKNDIDGWHPILVNTRIPSEEDKTKTYWFYLPDNAAKFNEIERGARKIQ